MQDPTTPRQQPMLFLVPIEGEGKSVEDLEGEAASDLLEVARRHLASLAGSTSRWLPFLDVIVEECSSAGETVASLRVAEP